MFSLLKNNEKIIELEFLYNVVICWTLFCLAEDEFPGVTVEGLMNISYFS